MNPLLSLIINAIFRGSLFVMPALVIIRAFKISLYTINQKKLVRAVGFTLRVGSLLYIVSLFISVFNTYYSGGEYEQYTFTNRLFGQYWWAIWLFIIFAYAFLPQLLWIKKVRDSTIGQLIIISVWGLLSFLTILPMLIVRGSWVILPRLDLMNIMEQVVVYLTVISLVYFVLTAKETQRAT